MTQRVALVTGAMGGLGSAICQQLCLAGHRVVAAYHPESDQPDEWVREMNDTGFNDFICVAGDVRGSTLARRWSPRPKPRPVRSTSWSITPGSLATPVRQAGARPVG